VSKLVSHRVFTSWVRRGAAAAIAELDPASGGWPVRASFARSVVLIKDGKPQPPISMPRPKGLDDQSLTLLDPGAVVGLLPKAILRTDPRDGATGVEGNYLVQIEFSRPDLPWMFTPAKANLNNRLRPWLVLIVVDASTVQLQPGTPLPSISVNDSDLPDLNDSWGWAHAQVTVDTPAGDVAAEETAAQVAAAVLLIPASGTSAVSRLMCPRLLQPNKTYLACVVPATEPGRLAGLGGTPAPVPGGIEQAWQAGARRDVVLPVYYSWRFSTGDAGDFKSLVGRLHGPRPTDLTGFGTRTVDMSEPWQKGDQLPPGTTVGLGGALGADVDEPLSDPAREAFVQRLITLLNFPADQHPSEIDANPLTVVAASGEEIKVFLSAVAPPIYAGRHAGTTTVPGHPGWLRTLNLDPRRRIAAAFGTQYVQENQEFLMAQAWNQLGAVQEANRLQALAELAGEVGDRMHQRHIAVLNLSKMVSIASPARTRILLESAQTLHAEVTASFVPSGAGTVAFSRFTRSLGPLARRTLDLGVTGASIKGGFTVIEKGLQNKLQPDTLFQAGVAGSANMPQPAVNNPTAGMVSLAAQTIAQFEKAVPALDLVSLVPVVNAAAQPPSASAETTLKLGLPILRLSAVAPIAKPLDFVANLRVSLATRLTPSVGILKRLQSRVRISDRLGADKTARIMACPQFTAPLAIAIKNAHPDWLLPGLGNFPDNCVTLLGADGAFVESFLAGANHEMNREFLWRGFPTDQRGTPFRYFWPRPDRVPDIPPITNWPLATPLGKNGTKDGPDVENMTVLLVRGELLHRYPRSIVHLARGTPSNDGSPMLDANEDGWTSPDFTLRLDDRTTAFAYNVSPDSIRGKPGFYFVFSEPITGPRFNFDVGRTTPMVVWNDLDWGTVQDSRGFAIAGSRLSAEPSNKESASWNRDAADIARIAFARPFRVAYHADELLAPPGA
jgi:hypothetical protein